MVRLSSVFVVAIAVVTGLAVPAAPVVAQTDTVALTVTVVDQRGATVGGATLEATWEDGSNTEETASNGKAFVDVPEGANVSIEVSHPNFVRNHPLEVTNASERAVTLDVHPEGTLRVQASDSEGALADTRVVIRQSGRIVASGFTDANGVYNSPTIEQGEYGVTVVKAGYFREVSDLTVDGDNRHSERLESGTVIYEFNVTDPHFDPPQAVAGASVELGGLGTVNTRESGLATIGIPVNTDVDLTVTKDGYDSESRSIDVGESETTLDVSISRSTNLTLVAANERTLAGESVVLEVRNAYDEPRQGASVVVDGQSVGTTDAEGEYAAALEEPGEHTIVARADGVESAPVTVEVVKEATESPTPTGTQSPTGTEEDSSGITAPGFSAPLVVLALALLAVVAIARSGGE